MSVTPDFWLRFCDPKENRERIREPAAEFRILRITGADTVAEQHMMPKGASMQ